MEQLSLHVHKLCLGSPSAAVPAMCASLGLMSIVVTQPGSMLQPVPATNATLGSAGPGGRTTTPALVRMMKATQKLSTTKHTHLSAKHRTSELCSWQLMCKVLALHECGFIVQP